MAAARGLCVTHGALGFCSTRGCDAAARRAHGVCWKHGDFLKTRGVTKVCSVDDCTNKVNARGLCTTHGKKPCTFNGCNATAHARGMCKKHDAKPKAVCSGKCKYDGCTTNAQSSDSNCCYVHGSEKRKPSNSIGNDDANLLLNLQTSSWS